jgi:hypothetical protein
MSSQAREKRDFRFKLAGALLMGIALFAAMPLSRMVAAENDFVHWYVGGLLFGTPDLHLEKPNQQKQVELIGSVLDHSYFIRPTFYGLLLKPLTWFPYLTAYWLYQVYSLACIGYFLWTFSRGWPDIWVYAAMSIPLISNMINGQDVSSLLLFCTVSIVLARKGRDFIAGLVFALCAIKFHLFLLTPVAMIAHKRWQLFWGAVVGETVLFLLGLTGGGWDVFLSLIALLKKPENHPYPELMPNLRGMLFALTGQATPVLLASVVLPVLAAALYLIIKAPTYEKSFAYCLIAGLIVNFHAYIQDPLLLLLTSALLLDGSESKAFRIVTQILLLPVVYMLLVWQPPYSALYAVLVVLSLLLAVRDQWRASELQPAIT